MSKNEYLSKEVMNALADSIENYLDFYNSIFIIPKDYKGDPKKIKKALKMTKKLVKKLRDHDYSILKDDNSDDEDDDF